VVSKYKLDAIFTRPSKAGGLVGTAASPRSSRLARRTAARPLLESARPAAR